MLLCRDCRSIAGAKVRVLPGQAEPKANMKANTKANTKAGARARAKVKATALPAPPGPAMQRQ